MMAGERSNPFLSGENQWNARIRIAVVGAQTSRDLFPIENIQPRVPHGDSPAEQSRHAIKYSGRICEPEFFMGCNQSLLHNCPARFETRNFFCAGLAEVAVQGSH